MSIKYNAIDPLKATMATWSEDAFSSEPWFHALYDLYEQIDSAISSEQKAYQSLFLADIEGFICNSLIVAPFGNTQVQLYNDMFKTMVNQQQLIAYAQSIHFDSSVLPMSFKVLSSTASMLGMEPTNSLQAMKDYGQFLVLLLKDLAHDRGMLCFTNTLKTADPIIKAIGDATKAFAHTNKLDNK